MNSFQTKAKKKYIDLCHKHNNEDEVSVALLWRYRAKGFMEAIEIVFGNDVAHIIGQEANLSFDDNIPRYRGIRLDRY